MSGVASVVAAVVKFNPNHGSDGRFASAQSRALAALSAMQPVNEKTAARLGAGDRWGAAGLVHLPASVATQVPLEQHPEHAVGSHPNWEAAYRPLDAFYENPSLGTIQQVPVGNLRTTQPAVYRAKVQQYIENADRHSSAGGVMTDHPRMVVYQGQHHILDGHHRVAADVLLGKKTITARVLNMDDLLNGSAAAEGRP